MHPQHFPFLARIDADFDVDPPATSISLLPRSSLDQPPTVSAPMTLRSAANHVCTHDSSVNTLLYLSIYAPSLSPCHWVLKIGG